MDFGICITVQIATSLGCCLFLFLLHYAVVKAYIDDRSQHCCPFWNDPRDPSTPGLDRKRFKNFFPLQLFMASRPIVHLHLTLWDTYPVPLKSVK